jgi:uncharacterized protein with GYD domain
MVQHLTKMPQYIILWNWTDQGIRNVKDAPNRINTFRRELENVGGKVIGFYSTAGQYDGVVILEAPDDDTMMSVLLSLGSKGNVRTITLKAFTIDEVAKIIGKLT